MQLSKGRVGVPTTLEFIFFCCATIVVGKLGYLPALHTNNGGATIKQRRNRKDITCQQRLKK
jgi:hypothetical protein